MSMMSTVRFSTVRSIGRELGAVSSRRRWPKRPAECLECKCLRCLPSANGRLPAALAWALVAPTRTYAADAQIDSFTINYDMQLSGVLKVKETIVWRLGSNPARHAT